MELIFVLVLVSLVWVFPAAYLTIAVWRSRDFSKAQKIKSTCLLWLLPILGSVPVWYIFCYEKRDSNRTVASRCEQSAEPDGIELMQIRSSVPSGHSVNEVDVHDADH